MKLKQLFAFAFASLMPVVVCAQQPSATQVKFFETNIRPALVKYCYECHSVEAGDSRGGLLRHANRFDAGRRRRACDRTE